MKILFVTASLTSGGSERVMSLLANAFVERGYEVCIVCLTSRKVYYTLSEKVQVVFAADFAGSMIGRLWRFRRFVRQWTPDVVIPLMTIVYCFTIFALLGLKIPVIASERIDPRYSPTLTKVLRSMLLPFVTHLVVQTQHIKSYYRKSIQRRTSIIVNPVSDQVFETEQNVLQEKRIISVGRFFAQKNHMMLIDAMAALHSKYPEYRLVIYGDGPLRVSLENKIEELKASDYISLPGRSAQVIHELRASTIFALSSDYEGMSNALLEAVCVGLPIVTTKVSGVEDVVKDNQGALIVAPKDLPAFTQALDLLLSDEKMQQSFAAYNRAQSEKYRASVIISQWEQLIFQVINHEKKN